MKQFNWSIVWGVFVWWGRPGWAGWALRSVGGAAPPCQGALTRLLSNKVCEER